MTKRALCFGVIIGVVVASAAHAADTTPQNEPLSWRSIIVRYDASGIDTNQRLKIGAPAVFAPYTTTDAITWAADLVIAPKRARDRQVMYAYDMSKLDPLVLKGLSEAARKDDLKVAVIAAQGPAVKVVGGTDGFYGTPVKWNSELFKVLAEKNGGKTSSVTTLLKDLGIDTTAAEQAGSGQAYFATSEPIKGLDKAMALVGSKSAWPMDQETK